VDFAYVCTKNNVHTLLGRCLMFSSGFALRSRIYIGPVYAYYLCLLHVDVSQICITHYPHKVIEFGKETKREVNLEHV